MTAISESRSPGRGGLMVSAARLPGRLGGISRAAGREAISLAGAALILAAVWALASQARGELPGPFSTMRTLWSLVSDPFYDHGAKDRGIGLQLIASLKRVCAGFALGTAAALPLGVALGASATVKRFVEPVVQVLRPVSPLAWFPIGLVMLHSAQDAAVFVVFITSLWPTVINTAEGVSSLPESHRNVARVFRFSRWKYLTKVVLPHSIPYVLTGLRLSMGIAWLVIVAAEMLSGSAGIGFFVWDGWHAFDLERVLSGILVIGIVGLLFDRAFGFVATRFAYPEVV